MKPPREPKSISLCARSRREWPRQSPLCLRIRETLQANGLSRFTFAVELLARECLSNAMIHGNLNNGDKTIDLRLDLGQKWIRLEVRDQGPGFRLAKALKNPMDQSAHSGRGLHLYKLYAQRVAVQPLREPGDSLDQQDEFKRKGRPRNGRLCE